jgi:hypothetical protein
MVSDRHLQVIEMLRVVWLKFCSDNYNMFDTEIVEEI